MGTPWSTDPADLLRAEQDIRDRLDDQELDFVALQAISNIYRAASAVRRRAERDLLTDAGLSWGGFTILWVLWVWGEMETSRLATECDLAKGTLTGMLTTLEKQGLVERRRVAEDRRRVSVSLTDIGIARIEDLFPRFNTFERSMTSGLTPDQQLALASLLRAVTNNADQ
ncbi:MAG: MarR family winged helix-turn-helix transcriptional regulator [Acidimicrobiales bacterium]